MNTKDNKQQSGSNPLATRWANGVRYSSMNIFILAGMVTMALGGWWLWLGLATTIVLVNIIDELLGDAGDIEAMPPQWYMNLMLRLTWPLLLIATLICLNTVGRGFPQIDAALAWFGFDGEAARQNTTYITGVGGLVSLGMFYGLGGVNVAHELVHRAKSKPDMILGRWLLAFTWDTGFAIEHVYGHHRHVGTSKDPATAKRGEYVFFFVVRSAVGQFLSALNFENERLKRRNIANTLWNNMFWRGQLMTLCVIALYTFMVGPLGFAYAALAAFVGKVYLEIVNYIEHYGLVRIPGERIEDRHSWDSHRRLSTGLTYNLPLHSNHHRFAAKPFWELQQAHGRAPLWPMGYVAMILCSFFPPLWRKISEPLLKDWDNRLASPAERDLLRATGQLRE